MSNTVPEYEFRERVLPITMIAVGLVLYGGLAVSFFFGMDSIPKSAFFGSIILVFIVGIVLGFFESRKRREYDSGYLESLNDIPRVNLLEALLEVDICIEKEALLKQKLRDW